MESPVHSTNIKQEEADGVSAGQYEVAGRTTTKKQKFIAHLRRFWWIYLIIALLLAAMAILLVIFVGVKNIAQGKINGAVLDVQGISCTNTKTDSFMLSINTTLKSGKTKATVDAFEGDMYLEDEPSHEPFATILFPETHNQPFQTVNVSQEIAIKNASALTLFNTWLLTRESVRVTVLGYPKVKVPGISHKYGVTFKKTVTLTGLNNFDGMAVSNSSISSSNFSDGTNFHTTVVIPNRSVVSFEIVSVCIQSTAVAQRCITAADRTQGNVTFATFLNGSNVGTSYVDNVFLAPGNNTYPYRATMAQLPVVSAVQSEPWCQDGVVPFTISGRSVENHGESLVYFSDALAAHNTSISIDLGTPFRAIGFDPKCPS